MPFDCCLALTGCAGDRIRRRCCPRPRCRKRRSGISRASNSRGLSGLIATCEGEYSGKPKNKKRIGNFIFKHFHKRDLARDIFGRIAVHASIRVVARRKGPSVFSIHLHRDLAARLSSIIRKKINCVSLKFLLDSTVSCGHAQAFFSNKAPKKINAL
jgi:hypothetical protein